jgi:ATP-dependent helicase/nuclease subunit B
MQASRTLSQWLADLASVLERAGQWRGLMADRAGQAVVQALRLSDGAWQEFSDLEARMSPASFIAWVDQTLEAGSYLPEHPTQTQVIILPLSQLLGRPLGAVVLPGCDELRLPVSPEQGGAWTPAQALILGLPLRADLTRAMRSAWDYALGYQHVDLLWRHSEAGDSVMASGFVLELLLRGASLLSDDPRPLRDLTQEGIRPPAPEAAALAPQRLSSTAYEDLRRCPYRFFALRQLALQEDEELEAEVDKRDFGNWLHATLRFFHESLLQLPDADLPERRRMIDAAADRVTREQDLPADEFLPFAAAWPQLREGYLKWLAAHESTGARFVQAEVGKTLTLGTVTLVGQLDRLDRLPDGSPLVMDYKTEGRQLTQARIGKGNEDTQLAFYALLMQDDPLPGTLSGSYVSVTERDGTKTCTPRDILGLRDQLLTGLAHDMEGIAQGRPLPALGHGEVCDYCAARGLCRRDFWEPATLDSLPSAGLSASEGLQHV